MKIGIPRSLFFYYYGDLWINFFENLGIDIVISPETNREIADLGIKYSNDEMCLSLKNYIGHVAYLKDRCDYILIPRIDNYGLDNQTCTNFLAIYDIISNLFDVNILNYNICYTNKEDELAGFIKIGRELGFKDVISKYAYNNSYSRCLYSKDKKISENIKKLKSSNKKVLIIGHPYNVYDSFIGKPIINFIKKRNVTIIYSNLFHNEITNSLSKKLSNELYFKFNKDLIGTILLTKNKIDGIIFLTSFPCGPDSLVNELLFRKLDVPYLNLVVDDIDSMVGYETRIDSFIDILEGAYL